MDNMSVCCPRSATNSIVPLGARLSVYCWSLSTDAINFQFPIYWIGNPRGCKLWNQVKNGMWRSLLFLPWIGYWLLTGVVPRTMSDDNVIVSHDLHGTERWSSVTNNYTPFQRMHNGVDIGICMQMWTHLPLLYSSMNPLSVGWAQYVQNCPTKIRKFVEKCIFPIWKTKKYIFLISATAFAFCLWAEFLLSIKQINLFSY